MTFLFLLNLFATIIFAVHYTLTETKRMAAIDNLTANIAALKAKLEAFIAAQQQNTEANIQAAADQVAALTAEIPG